ncbi:hypothetical protein [Salipiger mucosus]|nr:hypothetical protein [Salipiger mucosus]
MTDRRRDDEGPLAPWFEAGREAAPRPDGDWMARMEALALEEQPAAVSAAVTPPARRGRLRDLLGQIGGWPAMAGLAAACAAGLWIGVASPDGVAQWWPGDTANAGYTTFDPASGFDFAMLEL